MRDMIEYLESKGVQFKQSGSEHIADCIFCGKKKKFSVNANKGVFQCWVCGEAGNIWKLKKHYGDIDIHRIPTRRAYKVPQKGKVDVFHDNLRKNPEGVKFLKQERGLTADTIREFKLGSNEQGDISIPYFKDGKCVNFKYRNIKEKRFARESDCESVLYNCDAVDYSKPLIVVEGEFDCMSATQMGFQNVVSVTTGAGGFNNDWIDIFDSCKEIYIAFDNDEKGEMGAEALYKRLNTVCKRVLLPLKDFNDCLMAGHDRESLRKYFSQAKEYKPEEMIHITKVLEEVENDLFNEESLRGEQLEDWNDFNDQFGGIRPGEITTITGDTSTGKTTWTLNIVYKLIQMNFPVLIVSSEMPNKKVIGKMMSMYTGIPYHRLREDVYRAKLSEAMAFFSKKSMFFVNIHGEIDIERLQDNIMYAKRRYQVQYVMLDHLHYFLKAGASDKVGEIEKFMKGIVSVIRQTGIHAFLISHPSKLNNDKGYVTMNDLKGSSSIKQDSDNIISLWRDKEAQSTELKVQFQKVRDDSGREGIVKFQFEYDSQLYTEPIGIEK